MLKPGLMRSKDFPGLRDTTFHQTDLILQVSQPTISIIIPTFNSAKVLSLSLESVISQTFQDYEIIIQDGASADNTAVIADRYVKQGNKIRFVSEKDNGIYDAMNKAIQAANGRWIYFLGSDDRLHTSNVLDQVFNMPGIDDSDVVYGNVYSDRFNGIYDGKFDSRKLFDKNICHQAVFIKRSVFNKIGLFNILYKAHADWEHNFRWFLNPTLRVRYIEMIVADYADGGFSSITSDPVFYNEKIEKFYAAGKKSLDKDFKLNIAGQIAERKKQQKDFIGYLKFKFQYLLLKYA